MIKMFKKDEAGLKQIKDYEKDIWICLTNPSERECASISSRFGIPIDFLLDPLDSNERSRVEVEDEGILIVLRVPEAGEDEPGERIFYTLPVGIIFVEDAIITVANSHISILQEFIEGRVKNFSIKNKNSFLFSLFLRSTLLYLKYLKEINTITEHEEDRLQETMKNEELMSLLNLQKGLVYFSTSLKANELMMEKLRRGRIIKITEDEEDLLDDILIENRQAIEMTNIYSNILRDMMDAFSSIISNNLNIVMKFLTSITLILTIPTLIASIYGMNVPLPLSHSPHAFIIVIGISIVLSTVLTLIFKRKGLL